MTRLTIDPITRVEGHGRVELLIKKNRLVDVKVRLLESPRFFETLLVGRRYDEVPELICRICAICSAVHKLVSLRALEQAFCLEIPPLSRWIRELLLLGGHLQSHALHLFFLILPDFSEEASIVDLLKQNDPLAQAGLKLKSFGNQIQELAGGRIIHPVNPVLGGVVYRPNDSDLGQLMNTLLNLQKQWSDLAHQFHDRSTFPNTMGCNGVYLATGDPRRLALNGKMLWAEGHESIPVSDYATMIQEAPVKHSCAKESLGKAGPFLVGALARLNLLAKRGCPVNWTYSTSIHDNNAAQIYEIGWALANIRRLIEKILDAPASEPLKLHDIKPKAGVGTAAIEAPRGLLVHHYVIDEWGYLVHVDIVTPTAINQRLMTQQIKADLAQTTDFRKFKKITETIVRSFDPCISCAVHLLHG